MDKVGMVFVEEMWRRRKIQCRARDLLDVGVIEIY